MTMIEEPEILPGPISILDNMYFVTFLSTTLVVFCVIGTLGKESVDHSDNWEIGDHGALKSINNYLPQFL